MRTVLYFSLTALISLSGIIFAAAEGSPLAGISLLVALATLFFVDLEEKFAVPALIANLFGFVAFLVAGVEFFNGEIESRVLAGGHLIVYLTWVFLIQKKELRHFWWLCALSILQVATGSVLTKSIWFGGALVAYSFLATWTLSVFLLYRSTLGSGSKTDQESEMDEELQVRFVVGDQWRGISRDVDHRLLNWRFVAISGTMTMIGLFLSLMFFLFTPRIWIGQFSFLSDEASTGRPLTGFTEEVRLGDMGEILENAETVLELELSHTATEIPFTEEEVWSTLGPEPLFRGTVMETYENGRWKQISRKRFRRFSQRDRNAPITQKYQLSPIGSAALFTFGDTAFAESLTDGRVLLRQPFSDEIQRDPEAPLNRPFDYRVLSTAEDFDTTFSGQRNFWHRNYLWEFFGVYQRTLLEVPDDLERVSELANTIAKSSDAALQKAKRLEQFFTMSDQFTYSLDLSIQDASVDPIEDFLFNRKTGHCEYYASSMTIMLRCVGIPSRMVSGFKGGTYDKTREKFLVQQLHAHSWVEAYINGRWVTFDPTPAARAESVATQLNSTSSFKNLQLKMNRYWTTGIQLSKTQQQEMIYKPIQELGQQSWQNATNLLQGRTSGLKGLLNFLMSPGEWFSLQGGLLAFVFMSILSGFVWLLKRVNRLVSKMKLEGRKATQRIQPVEFYRRFLKILKRYGIEQSPTQTAEEFVAEAFNQLKPQLTEKQFTEWREDFVSTFYDVRFGGKELATEDVAEIHRQLVELESGLSQQEEAQK